MAKLYKMEDIYKKEIIKRKNKKVMPTKKDKIAIIAKNKNDTKINQNKKKEQNIKIDKDIKINENNKIQDENLVEDFDKPSSNDFGGVSIMPGSGDNNEGKKKNYTVNEIINYKNESKNKERKK